MSDLLWSNLFLASYSSFGNDKVNNSNAKQDYVNRRPVRFENGNNKKSNSLAIIVYTCIVSGFFFVFVIFFRCCCVYIYRVPFCPFSGDCRSDEFVSGMCLLHLSNTSE